MLGIPARRRRREEEGKDTSDATFEKPGHQQAPQQTDIKPVD